MAEEPRDVPAGSGPPVPPASPGAPEAEGPVEDDEDVARPPLRWSLVAIGVLILYGAFFLLSVFLMVHFTVGLDLQREKPNTTYAVILGLMMLWQLWNISRIARRLRYIPREEEDEEDAGPADAEFRIPK